MINTSEVDAVILAGGQGTRLKPLTLSVPKPVLSAACTPLLGYLLLKIALSGIKHVIISTSYRFEVFKKTFDTGIELGLDIEYINEIEALGTGGAIANAVNNLRHETTLVFNGDTLSGVNLKDLLNSHKLHSSDITLHLVRVIDPKKFGCVFTDSVGYVIDFTEKPQSFIKKPQSSLEYNQINGGCYVFKKHILEQIPKGKTISMEQEVFPNFITRDLTMYGYTDSSYWRDMGTVGDFIKGSADLVQNVAPSLVLNGNCAEFIANKNTIISPNALLVGGTSVGKNTKIDSNAYLEGSIVLDNVYIESNTVIKNSIIGSNVRVRKNTLICDSIVGPESDIGSNCELLHCTRIWPSTVLLNGSIRHTVNT